jgi:hypothetical protein
VFVSVLIVPEFATPAPPGPPNAKVNEVKPATPPLIAPLLVSD